MYYIIYYIDIFLVLVYNNTSPDIISVIWISKLNKNLNYLYKLTTYTYYFVSILFSTMKLIYIDFCVR